jgi:hypothetical protein
VSPAWKRYPSMLENGNQLSDFPAEKFTIFVFCNACGRQEALDRGRV